MSDLRTVVCARGPRSLADGRIVAHGRTATNVDVSHPENRAAIADGALVVLNPQKTTRGRKAQAKR